MKLFINLFLFLLVFSNCWSQDKVEFIEVTYVRAYKNFKDSTNARPKPIENLEYRLTCTSDKARFELTLNIEDETEDAFYKVISRSGGQGIYYKNNSEKVKLHQVESPVNKQTYLINLPFDEYQWEFSEEKKFVNGYLCNKAFADYEIEVPNQVGEIEKVTNRIVIWYSPEISYPFGPAGYDGLPGLVMEMNLGSFYFMASNISYKENVKDEDIIRPSNGIKISKAEYSQHFIDAYKKYKD